LPVPSTNTPKCISRRIGDMGPLLFWADGRASPLDDNLPLAVDLW